MAAVLVYKTIAKKVFWEFDSIIVQNFSDILSLFLTTTRAPHHVSENQESDTEGTISYIFYFCD